MSSHSNQPKEQDLYRFDIQNGTVTSVQQWDHGYWKQERMDANESYAIQGPDVVKTERSYSYSEVSRYSDPEQDGLYVKVSETKVANTLPSTPTSTTPTPTYTAPTHSTSNTVPMAQAHGLYDFGIINGQVTQVLKSKYGVLKNERIDANESYTVQGTEVIKIETKAYGQELTRYVDPEGDGLYAKFSEQWQPIAGSANGVTPVSTRVLYDRGGDDTDDHLAVRAGQDPALGGLGADTFVVRELGHVTIGDFHHNQHDRLAFDTGLGLNSMQDLVNLVTDLRWQNDDLVLELGAQASVTLVGALSNGIGLEDIDVLS